MRSVDQPLGWSQWDFMQTPWVTLEGVTLGKIYPIWTYNLLNHRSKKHGTFDHAFCANFI